MNKNKAVKKITYAVKKTAVRGRPPISKKAPIASDDDFSENEGPTSSKTQTRRKEAESEDESAEEEEEEVVRSKKKETKKKESERMVEMVSFKYLVEDEHHPFYNLNNVVGSVDITKIISKNFDKNRSFS